MAKELSRPVQGVVFVQDERKAIPERAKARRMESTDHADGGSIVGRNSDRPVLVQKMGVDENGQFIVEDSQPVAASMPVPPGDPVPARAPETVQPARFVKDTIIEPASPRIPADAILSIAQAPAQPVTKIAVKFSGDGLGRMTVFCREVVVNESLVILSFPQDGTTAIVEPPKADSSNPLKVTINSVDYLCLSNEWSFELLGRVFVVLIRVPG